MAKPRERLLNKDGTEGSVQKWYKYFYAPCVILLIAYAVVTLLAVFPGIPLLPCLWTSLGCAAGAILSWGISEIGQIEDDCSESRIDHEWSEFVKGLPENAGSYKQSVEIWTQCDQEIEKLSGLIKRVRWQVTGDNTQLPDALKQEVLSALELDKTPAVPSLSTARALYELGKQLEATRRRERFHRERLNLGFEYWKRHNRYITGLSNEECRTAMTKDNVDYSQPEPPKGYSGGWTNPYGEPDDDFPGPPDPQVVPPPDHNGVSMAFGNLAQVDTNKVTIVNNTNANTNANT